MLVLIQKPVCIKKKKKKVLSRKSREEGAGDSTVPVRAQRRAKGVWGNSGICLRFSARETVTILPFTGFYECVSSSKRYSEAWAPTTVA